MAFGTSERRSSADFDELRLLRVLDAGLLTTDCFTGVREAAFGPEALEEPDRPDGLTVSAVALRPVSFLTDAVFTVDFDAVFSPRSGDFRVGRPGVDERSLFTTRAGGGGWGFGRDVGPEVSGVEAGEFCAMAGTGGGGVGCATGSGAAGFEVSAEPMDRRAAASGSAGSGGSVGAGIAPGEATGPLTD